MLFIACFVVQLTEKRGGEMGNDIDVAVKKLLSVWNMGELLQVLAAEFYLLRSLQFPSYHQN